MVDTWMIFTMSYPFLVIACHCGKEVKVSIYKFEAKLELWCPRALEPNSQGSETDLNI